MFYLRSKNGKSILWFFSGGVCFLGLFLFAGLSRAGDVDAGETRLAMHFGRPHHGSRHSLHHGMGRVGKGLCPQHRTAPQAPEDIEGLPNPLESSRENYYAGESLYHVQAEPTACKICHGSQGNGMGMMAQGLLAMPRNFTCKETMNEITDGQMFWVIKNGTGNTGMPPYKFLSDDQIWQLVLYIRRFVE